MEERPPGPPRAAVTAAVTLVVAFLLCTALLPAAAAAITSDVAQFAAAAAAAATTARHARRSTTSRLRTAWWLLSAACWCWAAGQGYWSWLSARGFSPFPSLADAGFLGFAVLAVAALSVYPAVGGRTGVGQRICDAVMTASAVGLISWKTTLGAVIDADETHADFAGALLVAYPVADLALVVLVVLLLTRTRGDRTALNLLGLGLVAQGLADSTFAYLAATSAYDGGSVDVGWVLAFSLIAVAGSCPPLPGRFLIAAASRRVGPNPSVPATFLPYLPVAAALGLALSASFSGSPLTRGEVAVVAVVIVALLTRQYAVVRANVRLATQLAAREAELHHLAFHDPLTGLPNRALFHERLAQAVAEHARDARPVAVIFCDLDDFKAVNDTFGHATGDRLLVRVAERLTAAVRADDTVARLGGDEFAILLAGSDDPTAAAARITDALSAPIPLDGPTLPVRVSLGIGQTQPDDASVTVDALLARSDAAMYAAKHSSKATGRRGATAGTVDTRQVVLESR